MIYASLHLFQYHADMRAIVIAKHVSLKQHRGYLRVGERITTVRPWGRCKSCKNTGMSDVRITVGDVKFNFKGK